MICSFNFRPCQEMSPDPAGLKIIGHIPNTQFLESSGIALDENGYVIQDGHSTASNIEGRFSAGDVSDHVYRQVITAAGNGCQAALDSERFLAELD